jgi:hypothetical protein
VGEVEVDVELKEVGEVEDEVTVDGQRLLPQLTTTTTTLHHQYHCHHTPAALAAAAVVLSFLVFFHLVSFRRFCL